MKFTTLLWIPQRLLQPRSGYIGRLMDVFWPRYIDVPGGGRFVATGKDGEICSSPDGCTWTVQSTPGDE